MTAPVNIDELERLLEKATPGPWEYETGPSLKARYHTVRGGSPSVMVCECYEGSEVEQEANAEAITALRNAAPSLIAELRRLENIRIAAQNLADYVAKSVNAGPVTKGPHREAKLWHELRAALNPTPPQGDTP